MPETTDQDRINVILLAEDRALLAKVMAELGGGPRSRSLAIRYAIRCAAEKLGIPTVEEKKKKRR